MASRDSHRILEPPANEMQAVKKVVPRQIECAAKDERMMVICGRYFNLTAMDRVLEGRLYDWVEERVLARSESMWKEIPEHFILYETEPSTAARPENALGAKQADAGVVSDEERHLELH